MKEGKAKRKIIANSNDNTFDNMDRFQRSKIRAKIRKEKDGEKKAKREGGKARRGRDTKTVAVYKADPSFYEGRNSRGDRASVNTGSDFHLRGLSRYTKLPRGQKPP